MPISQGQDPDGFVHATVLAWNHVQETVACVDSLLRSDYPYLHIAVVDNASTDGTYETLSEKFPSITVIRSSSNIGISGGYNLGLEHALKNGARFAMVTNNDVIADGAMIRHLVAALESRDTAGMAMPKIFHYYGKPGRLWCPGAYWRRFPPEVKMTSDVPDSYRYNVLREIDYAPSCCLLMRREALERVGYFDTSYFFYYDDWDYSLRLRKAGYKILFVPEAKLLHKVSISTQKSDKPARWWHVMGRSTVLFYLRHFSPLTLALFSIWFVVREGLKLQFERIAPFVGGVVQGLRSSERI